MHHFDELYEKYELLLPPRFEGGYLVLSLSEKIAARDIDNHFTTADIRLALEEIARRFGQPVAQSERTIKNLLHYFLRTIPGEYGQFYLTDHALRMVEAISNKIRNPYKNFPLKESFDKYFVIRFAEVKTALDLELKFGREFVAGHKRIINDHVESFEDELNEAYGKLNTILRSDLQDATIMVKEFAGVFKKFGDRAEDILNAIAAKDMFLRKLRSKVDEFYAAVDSYKNPVTEEDRAVLVKLQRDQRMALGIYQDLDTFFKSVDAKIDQLRKRILNASGKLTELQENFSDRSHFRLLIKRLLQLSLETATYHRGGVTMHEQFPLKNIVYEKTQLFYPPLYNFYIPENNKVIVLPPDDLYGEEQRKEIERDIKRQEIISAWIKEISVRLENGESLSAVKVINEITGAGNEMTVAQHVMMAVTEFAAETAGYDIVVEHEPQFTNDHTLVIWKLNIQKSAIMFS